MAFLRENPGVLWVFGNAARLALLEPTGLASGLLTCRTAVRDSGASAAEEASKAVQQIAQAIEEIASQADELQHG